MLILCFHILLLNFFTCIFCLSLFLETYQHLSQEHLWIKCTKKLYIVLIIKVTARSKWQARCFFIVHNLTSSRPCWYTPLINQLIPLCQDKKFKWHMTHNSWHIIHVAQLMNKYIQKLQCFCVTSPVREGLKNPQKNIYLHCYVNFNNILRVSPPPPLFIFNDFITILWNIKYCPHCWTTPPPNLSNKWKLNYHLWACDDLNKAYFWIYWGNYLIIKF